MSTEKKSEQLPRNPNLELAFAASQIKGTRRYQEDSFRIFTDKISGTASIEHLFVLCDGMGGHRDGNVASTLVCKVFTEAFAESQCSVQERLMLSLEQANRKLADEIQGLSEGTDMGTTLVAAWVMDNCVSWISVGDSPLWLIRDNRIKRLNEDHSMSPVFQKMVELGQMSAEEAASDPKRHVLRSAVRGDQIRIVDQSTQPFALHPQDQLLLATDGLETLSEQTILQVIQDNRAKACDKVLSTLFNCVNGLALPEQDNASAIFIRLPESNTSSQPQKQSNLRVRIVLWMFYILGAMTFSALATWYYWDQRSIDATEFNKNEPHTTSLHATSPSTSDEQHGDNQ